MMDVTVERMGEMQVVGMVRRFALDGAFAKVPGFWDEYHQKGLDKTLCGYLGLCFDETEKDFAYLIGAFRKEGQPVPEGFEVHTVAPHLWAKFRAVGPLPGAIQKVNRQIFTEWLPGNPEYEPAEGINLEVYSEGDMTGAEYESEIWLPVRRRGDQ